MGMIYLALMLTDWLSGYQPWRLIKAKLVELEVWARTLTITTTETEQLAALQVSSMRNLNLLQIFSHSVFNRHLSTTEIIAW